MKRLFALIIAVFATFLLCACGDGLVFEEKPVIQFAKDNSDLFARCVNTICSDYLSNDWPSTLILREGKTLFICSNGINREETKSAIHSQELSELFETGQIKIICIWKTDDSLSRIEFHMDSVGMGSYSINAILYVPSDRIEDVSYYSDRMQFSEFREGYMGTIEGSDDYLYYEQISPQYFYIEYGD